MSLDLTYEKSILLQVMAWCCQATSHYLSQSWPRFMSPYGVTRPQWVNMLRPGQNDHRFVDDTIKMQFIPNFFLKFDSTFNKFCSYRLPNLTINHIALGNGLAISNKSLIWSNVIRTLHDCLSQMNENLLISNSKLTSDSELIWWR